MTVIQFLNYMNYGCGLPDDEYRPYYIDKGRWKGMIKWYHTRTGEKYDNYCCNM